MLDLSEAVALVTGGAGGIGLAVARSLAGAGVRVALADIDAPTVRSAAAELGDGAIAIPLDVRDRNAWDAARAMAEARFGPVDILVNNAGIGPDGYRLDETTPESFDRIVAINLTGMFNGIHCFVPGMRARGRGHVVNTASMAGLTAMPRLGGYTATKFAVVGLSEVLRAELAPDGVGVSVLCPGLVKTRLGETSHALGSDRSPDLPLSPSVEGMDAGRVGDAVLAAIRADRPLIITHGEHRRMVEKRMERVLAAFDDVPDSRGTAA
ncbi:SDR family oxidoreductase [Sphingobium sp. Sx8-8]|uniref:SDR family oxidoreductase n=1 Tax=Sphingobium sp. Sx8-8 TaxID=2933617 RepID=UPI001F55DA35|nr:SDR family oxidoreductase [Sphingobium sp. Sx8-8]